MKTNFSLSNVPDTRDKAYTQLDESKCQDHYMVVLNMVRVETGLFEMVERLLRDIYPYLIVGAVCTPVDLIGEPIWDELGGLSQRHALYCLRHLAKTLGAPIRYFESGGVSFFEIMKSDKTTH